MPDIYRRPLPVLTNLNRHFWTSGAEGLLRLLRCRDCGFWVHVPQPRCTRCLGENLSPEPVSGRGVVETFTINVQPWAKGMAVPFVLAVIGLPEQDRLRVSSNIVGVAVEDVRIGMSVHVLFEQDEDIWLPMFTPG